MKKILLLAIFAALFGVSTKLSAQCNGVSVTITNISVNTTATHYVYSFIWSFLQGNASIQVRFRCGTNYTYEGRCFPRLNDSTAGPHFVKDSIAITAPPNCPPPAVKTLVIGIWTNNQCGGGFCEVQGGQIPLPVKFASFNATRSNSNVLLKWETASEQNNSGFAVERNINGSWEQVAFVASQAVNGNSEATLSYQYIDLNNTKGITQYRIKQVDIDAKSKYSEIRSVRGDGQLGKTIVYPNPTNDGKVNVVFEDGNVSRDISVSDMSGRTVKQLRGITNNNITIENLTPGMYSLRIVIPSTGEQSVEKIVVNKR